MADSNPTEYRAQLFQLLALCFAHPTEDVHAGLCDESLIQAIKVAGQGSLQLTSTLNMPTAEFADFEAEYIDLFQVGHRGKPKVNLSAGDYLQLLDSQSRPEFLLQYSAWYRHFGVKTRQDEFSNELPDHIVCQLEFMAWLSQLEAKAEDNTRQDYQRAQRDFCTRHLLDFVSLMDETMQAHESLFFAQLSHWAHQACERTLALCEAQSGPYETDYMQHDAANARVNLWG